MNLNFISDPNLVPRPQEEVRFLNFDLEPYTDHKRIRLEIQLTPFMPQVRPNIEITAYNQDKELVASANIIETTSYLNYLTLHLRDTHNTGTYLFKAILYFDNAPEQDSALKTLNLNSAG